MDKKIINDVAKILGEIRSSDGNLIVESKVSDIEKHLDKIMKPVASDIAKRIEKIAGVKMKIDPAKKETRNGVLVYSLKVRKDFDFVLLSVSVKVPDNNEGYKTEIRTYADIEPEGVDGTIEVDLYNKKVNFKEISQIKINSKELLSDKDIKSTWNIK